MTGDEWSAPRPGARATRPELATRDLAMRDRGPMRDLATRDLDDRAACPTNPGNYT